MNERDRLSTDDIARREREARDAKQQREEYVSSGGAGAARTRDPNPQSPPARQTAEERHAALFPERDITELRSRWDAIQTGFVDEPRHAVQQADELVAHAMKRLAEVFSDERRKLEAQWDRGDSASTEDLRIALRRYRSFFGRLLSL